MQTALLVLAGLYVLSRMQGTSGPVNAPRPATGTVTPIGGTRVNIPGVGEYYNVPGAGVSITLDPSFYGRFLPSTEPPMIAQPSNVPDYQAWDVPTSDPLYSCADPFSPCFA